MKSSETYRLAVLLERHEGAVPATSVALAELTFSLARVYEMGGVSVPLDDLIERARTPFPWMFRSVSKES